jgi:uncharacterized membrane protein YdjX (TVP38/TMEM64 family)
MKITPAKWKFYIFIFLILSIILISIIFNAKGYPLIFYNALKQMHLGVFLPLVYISLYVISSFFPLPLLSLLGATIFPFYEAFIFSIIGNIFFFTLTFYMTRWFGRDYVEMYETNHPKIKKLSVSFSKNSFFYVFLLRLVFIIPRHVVNTIAGLSRMRFKNYLFASILGAIPVVLVSILLIKGYQMKEFYLIILSLILLMLFIIIPYFLIKELREYFKKK